MGETFMVEGGEGLKAAELADLELEGPGNVRLDQLCVGARRTLSQCQHYEVIFGAEIDSSA